MTIPALASVDELFAVLTAPLPPSTEGRLPAEAVGPLEHHLQCAHCLRCGYPDDVELQVAGLVHDVGHALAPGDEATHGTTGALAVRGLLGERVAHLVELHVPAKRYLTAVDPDYRRRLSPASTVSLRAQGGTMSADEVYAFAADPDAPHALELRSADEAAKVPGLVVPALATWRPVLEAVIANVRGRPASPPPSP